MARAHQLAEEAEEEAEAARQEFIKRFIEREPKEAKKDEVGVACESENFTPPKGTPRGKEIV